MCYLTMKYHTHTHIERNYWWCRHNEADVQKVSALLVSTAAEVLIPMP